MNKAELIDAIAASINITQKDVNKVINAFIEQICVTLKKGDEVRLGDLGSFKVKTRAARTGRNPKTGEAIKIPEAKVPHFSAAKALKDSVR